MVSCPKSPSWHGFLRLCYLNGVLCCIRGVQLCGTDPCWQFPVFVGGDSGAEYIWSVAFFGNFAGRCASYKASSGLGRRDYAYGVLGSYSVMSLLDVCAGWCHCLICCRGIAISGSSLMLWYVGLLLCCVRSDMFFGKCLEPVVFLASTMMLFLSLDVYLCVVLFSSWHVSP